MLNSLNYLVYLTFSMFITVFVSRTLSKNGLPFLVTGFKGNEQLAVSTNHLLVVGFYLVNLGFVLLRMRTDVRIDTFEQLIVYQSSGLGFVLFVLGLAHFFNMYVIHKMARSGINFYPLTMHSDARAHTAGPAPDTGSLERSTAPSIRAWQGDAGAPTMKPRQAAKPSPDVNI